MRKITYLGLLCLLFTQVGCTDKKEAKANDKAPSSIETTKDTSAKPANQESPVVPGNLEEGMK